MKREMKIERQGWANDYKRQRFSNGVLSLNTLIYLRNPRRSHCIQDRTCWRSRRVGYEAFPATLKNARYIKDGYECLLGVVLTRNTVEVEDKVKRRIRFTLSGYLYFY